MNGNVTNKEKISQKAPLTARVHLLLLKFQLYLAMHTKAETMFAKGCWCRKPRQPSTRAAPKGQTHSKQLKLLENFNMDLCCKALP